MPTISGLVANISADVVARLAAKGLPPLVDGRIVLGQRHLAENLAPPRVIFVPKGSRFGPRDTANASPRGQITAEMKAQWATRAIHSDVVRFEVHVWAAATPTPDPEGGDFDAAQALYHLVIASIRTRGTGTYTLTDGEWPNQEPGGTQHLQYGYEFVFGLEIGTPILDEPYTFAPSTVSGRVIVEFTGATSGDPDNVIVLTP